mmetsp:Transcript_107865/g.348150  ORF Transcript_107865/g.348150 Transcript_107865/m.348150 type:complete len:376 (+) Transcript_107865:436-1563(+)
MGLAYRATIRGLAREKPRLLWQLLGLRGHIGLGERSGPRDRHSHRALPAADSFVHPEPPGVRWFWRVRGCDCSVGVQLHHRRRNDFAAVVVQSRAGELATFGFETKDWGYTSGYTQLNGKCFSMTENKKPVAGITAYQQLPQNDARALMQAVLVNPVTVSVDAGNWNYYSTGIFAGCDTQNPVINHAVVLNGFGKERSLSYWLVRNNHHGLWHVRHPVGLGLPVGGLPRCAHRSGIAQKGRIDLAARLPRRPSRGCRWRRVHPAAARAVKWRWRLSSQRSLERARASPDDVVHASRSSCHSIVVDHIGSARGPQPMMLLMSVGNIVPLSSLRQCNTDNRVDGWSDHESLTVELDGQDYFYMSAPSNSWVCLREWG